MPNSRVNEPIQFQVLLCNQKGEIPKPAYPNFVKSFTEIKEAFEYALKSYSLGMHVSRIDKVKGLARVTVADLKWIHGQETFPMSHPKYTSLRRTPGA